MNVPRVAVVLCMFALAASLCSCRSQSPSQGPRESYPASPEPRESAAPVANETNTLPGTITVDGLTYSNVTWHTVTPATVTIFHQTGVAAIPLEKLPPELQKRFGYDPQKAAEYIAAERSAEAARQEALRKRLAAEEAQRQAAQKKLEQQQALEREARLRASGGFTCRNVSNWAFYSLRQMDFTGEVVNTTSNDWDVARFVVNLYDTDGNNIECSGNAFTVYAIKRGETQSTTLHLFFLGLSPQEFTEATERLGHAHFDFMGGEETAYYSFAMTSPKASTGLTFSDDEIAASFKISSNQFAFAISNKTGQPIKIDWNQISYVDALGKAHKAIHEGVKYTDKGQPQPITIVPPGAFVNDVIIPVDSVHFSEGYGDVPGGWEVDPLFPQGHVAKTYEGATVSAFMPLEVNGAVKNYSFVFKITGVGF